MPWLSEPLFLGLAFLFCQMGLIRAPCPGDGKVSSCEQAPPWPHLLALTPPAKLYFISCMTAKPQLTCDSADKKTRGGENKTSGLLGESLRETLVTQTQRCRVMGL